MKSSFSLIVRLFFLLILLQSLVIQEKAASAESPLTITQSLFRQVPCLEEQRYRYHRDTIRALNYTGMRAFRAFCTLPSITANDAVDALEHLVFYPLSFNQVRLFEFYAGLPDVSVEAGWQFLDLTGNLEFTVMQAALEMVNIKKLDRMNVPAFIERLKRLDDSGRWAAKALFARSDIDGTTAEAGLEIIELMKPNQQRAAEQACLLADSTAKDTVNIFRLILTLDDSEALNSRGLLSLDTISADKAVFWINQYFSRPRTEAESLYYTLEDGQKAELLTSFSAAALDLIRKINDLHSVTDRYGAEIGLGTLVASSPERLLELFGRLHPQARNRYRKVFDDAIAGNRAYDAVEALKNATALARRLTAADLTSPNIYVLLSHGSELYDSSFRDILVPVLLERIGEAHSGNLLDFLLKTDPASHYVADFVVSCAQKGKLTAFFPVGTEEQRRIIDLMAESAFRNAQSLILFSATFDTLLAKLNPPARTYLIGKMIGTINEPESTFALQLRVILQYYLGNHPDLLSNTDQSTITALIDRYGSIDLKPFIKTDFNRWKEDGKLSSLSVFQHDDDGQISYLSNALNLLEHGYTPRISKNFMLLPDSSPEIREAHRLINQKKNNNRKLISSLYSLSVRSPVIIEWHKKVNGIELSHALAVYQSRESQRRLLRLFLESGMEMFAQRGHSYWREEQLLEPLRKLSESGGITADIISRLNRFMSIGSCGGIRVYTELNELFDNSVDIFATVGTGKAIVNDPYNRNLFEIIATADGELSWEAVARASESIFADERSSDYLQPGSLPAILHKMIKTRNQRIANGAL